MSHTPAPWIAEIEFDGTKTSWIKSFSGEYVVEYKSCGSHAALWNNPEDFTLVLAAPELLEALKAVEANIAETDSCMGGFEVMVNKIKAAIAKAEGK